MGWGCGHKLTFQVLWRLLKLGPKNTAEFFHPNFPGANIHQQSNYSPAHVPQEKIAFSFDSHESIPNGHVFDCGSLLAREISDR